MSAESSGRRPLPELDAEQEVDFGRYWRAVLSRWWLPVVGVFVGAVIGALVTIGGATEYKATSQVYLGQPLAPGAAAAVSSVPTTLGLISSFVTSEVVVKRVARRVGFKVSKLRGRIRTKPILGITGARLGTPAPLLAITVNGRPPARVAAAANALGAEVVGRLNSYVKSKIDALEDNLRYDDAQLNAVEQRLADARARQQRVLDDKSISPTDKLVTVANLNLVITQALQQQNTFNQERFTIRQQLSLARDIESPRIVATAGAVKSEGPGRRSAILIGAFVGLLVGLIAALLWEPVTTRLRPNG